MNLNDSACHPGDGTKELNRLPYLAEPLLRFDLQQELQNLRREDSWDRETGRSSKTLAKYPDFRIVLVLMKNATHMGEHRNPGQNLDSDSRGQDPSPLTRARGARAFGRTPAGVGLWHAA